MTSDEDTNAIRGLVLGSYFVTALLITFDMVAVFVGDATSSYVYWAFATVVLVFPAAYTAYSGRAAESQLTQSWATIGVCAVAVGAPLMQREASLLYVMLLVVEAIA